MSTLNSLIRWSFVGVLISACTGSLQACATCFGASDDPMAKGMNMGILSLLIVIVSVLCGIAAFFIFLARRSIRLAVESQPRPNPAN